VTWALHFNYPPVFLWCLPIASQRQSSVQRITILVKNVSTELFAAGSCVLSIERGLYPAHCNMTHLYNLFPWPPCFLHCYEALLACLFKEDCWIKSRIAPWLSPDALETKVSRHCRSKPWSLGRPACCLVTVPVEHVMNYSGSLQVHLCNSLPASTVKNVGSSAGIVTTLGAVTTALRPTRETHHWGQYCQEYSDWCVKLATLPCTVEG
jgi:hypothetical protein